MGAEGALETALVLMGLGPERATVEEREEGGRRSMSTKTKSRVDEAIRSYGYRAASHVETSTRGRCERHWRLRRLYG